MLGLMAVLSPACILLAKLAGTVEQAQEHGIQTEQQQAPKRAQANVCIHQPIGLPSYRALAQPGHYGSTKWQLRLDLDPHWRHLQMHQRH